MRILTSLLALLLAACASTGGSDRQVLITTAENGQSIEGAACSVTNNVQRWDIVTPANLTIEPADGDLHIVCDKEGYRGSELRLSPMGMPSGSSIGLGLGGASGGVGSAVGAGLGLTLPFGGSRRGYYPAEITVNMMRQE